MGGGRREGVKNRTNMHAQQAVAVAVIDRPSNAPPDNDFSISGGVIFFKKCNRARNDGDRRIIDAPKGFVNRIKGRNIFASTRIGHRLIQICAQK